ncbi:hypothetical protein [Methanimicrococcus stummii]|nr:hypothetical protein [Methanimicrococcus sp. Es2]
MYIELPGTENKTGQLKTLRIRRNGSTGTTIYLTMVDKNNAQLVPVVSQGIPTGATGDYNMDHLVLPFNKKSSTDRILIRSNGTNTAVLPTTLFETGYIQTGGTP